MLECFKPLLPLEAGELLDDFLVKQIVQWSMVCLRTYAAFTSLKVE